VSRRRIRIVLVLAAVVGIALLICAPLAQAKGVLGSGVGPTVGPDLNPLPSIGELIKGVANGLFGALLSALTPGFLKHADIATLQWLVALPDVADSSVWPTVCRLEEHVVWVAGAILPTALIVATARDTALSLAFRAHPGNALMRFIGAVFWLVLYRFAFANSVAFVNVLTHTILSWPIVAEGLHRTVLVMFGGSVIFGAGGAFLGVLGLVALVLAVCLFMLKVLILTVTAILFVSGPLFIALTPLPIVGDLARGWLLALVGICLIPIGWCIVFAVAGAIGLDVTNLGGGAHIGSRIVGAFACLVTFYLAWKWPLMVLGHVRSSLGGLGVRPGAVSGGGGGPSSNGALAAKAQRARAGLQSAMLAGGRGVGLAAGQLGAPRGGLAGLAGRQARPHLATAAVTGAIAAGPPRSRPRPKAASERVAKAGAQLRETPSRMRQAWRAGSAASASPASARTGTSPTRGNAGAPTTPGARPAGTQRKEVPGTAPGQPRRADHPGPAPRQSGTGSATGQGASRVPTRPVRGGAAAPPQPPVVPAAHAPAAGTPTPPPPSSSRDPQSAPGSVARKQASAPAQPQTAPRPPRRAPRTSTRQRTSRKRGQR
jgi:hypothetical protein